MNQDPVTGVAAGVPFVALPPPAGRRPGAPAVFAWHLLDPPRTPAAFAAALPLAGLDAWRIYLGLPMTGDRAPAGGVEELFRLAGQDAVRKLHGPISARAAEEFGGAYADLRDRFGLGDGPVGLVGGSLGSAVAQLVLAAGPVPAAAAVLISPMTRLRPMIDVLSREFGTPYEWTPEADEVAARLDFAARAGEIAGRGGPAVLVVVGADDLPGAVAEPARETAAALATRYADPDRVELVTLAGMAHALADEPGEAPAPQTPVAARVDRLAADWLGRHLPR
jgi:pimeloyl-ACP methyl ester carboxylesterase